MPLLNHVRVSLRIVGDDVDPDEITQLLGREPDFGLRKGQTVVSNTGKERVERRGRWIIQSERRDPSDPNTQLRELLESTTSDVEVWKSITAQHHVDIFCGLFMLAENEGLVLSPETIKMIGDRGIPLWFDVYAPERRPRAKIFDRWLRSAKRK